MFTRSSRIIVRTLRGLHSVLFRFIKICIKESRVTTLYFCYNIILFFYEERFWLLHLLLASRWPEDSMTDESARHEKVKIQQNCFYFGIYIHI